MQAYKACGWLLLLLASLQAWLHTCMQHVSHCKSCHRLTSRSRSLAPAAIGFIHDRPLVHAWLWLQVLACFRLLFQPFNFISRTCFNLCTRNAQLNGPCVWIPHAFALYIRGRFRENNGKHIACSLVMQCHACGHELVMHKVPVLKSCMHWISTSCMFLKIFTSGTCIWFKLEGMYYHLVSS